MPRLADRHASAVVRSTELPLVSGRFRRCSARLSSSQSALGCGGTPHGEKLQAALIDTCMPTLGAGPSSTPDDTACCSLQRDG